MVNVSQTNLSSTDKINAGAADTDVLNITDTTGTLSFADAIFTNLSNFETLNLGNGSNDTITLGSTYVKAAGFTKVYGQGGDDSITISDTTNLITVDGGTGGSDSLTLSTDNMSFTNLTISNFETINVNGSENLSGKLDSSVTAINIANGKTLTVGAADLDGKTISVTATGNLTINATATAADHDFGGITKSGTGTITLNVAGTVDLSGHNLGAVNYITVATTGQTVTLTDSQLSSLTTVSGAGNVTVKVSADSSTDFATKLVTTGTETINFTANSIFSGTLGNSSSSIDSGVTLSANGSVIDGKTISGAGTLNITGTGDGNLDLTNVTSVLTADIDNGATTLSNLGVNLDATNSSSNLTITETTGKSLTITGGSGDDTFNMSDGTDTVNLGAGNDTINVANGNLTSADTISDTSGTSDTLNVTGGGSIASTVFTNVSGIENLNFDATNADTVTFTDDASFNAWTGKFGTIDAKGGSDTISFGSAVNADLDFTKLHNFETLTFSGFDDSVTFGSDEYSAGLRTLNLGDGTNSATLNDTSSAVQVNGGTGSDSFTLDFTRLTQGDYNINGGTGAGSDTVTFSTGSTSSISTDTDFSTMFTSTITNIEAMDIKNVTLNTADSNTEFNFTDTMIKQWTGNATGTLSLSLTSAQTELIKFTDSGNTVHDTQLSAGTYNYTLKDDTTDGSTTLHLIVS